VLAPLRLWGRYQGPDQPRQTALAWTVLVDGLLARPVEAFLWEDDMKSFEGREGHKNTRAGSPFLDRRDLLKACVGAGVWAARTPKFSASTEDQDSTSESKAAVAETGPGWRNEAHRASGNGPMDDESRELVHYVGSFSERDLTNSLVDAVSLTMLDSIASLIAGFESEPARITARMARSMRSDLKSTVLGYGITTSPEMATLANGIMLRYSDFNDVSPGGHFSDMISAVLAVGEAFHSTGTQVMVAIALAYEIAGALAAAGANAKGWDSPFELPAVALAVGKLMSLSEDQLANALSLALVAHMPMSVSHEGTLSMWKGCHAAESARCAVFSTMLAREGLTGPCQPFRAKGGLFDHIGSFKALRLPSAGTNGEMVIERTTYKRYPSEAATQSVLDMIPAVRAWTQPDDISAILIELPYSWWQELADPPKWDPLNRETADHSLPCVVARALIDGEIYVDSFSPAKIADPAVRRLMTATRVRPNTATAAGLSLVGVTRLTVRTKTRGELVKEAALDSNTPMTREEIVSKFERVCAARQVVRAQQDRAREQWLNLGTVHDIAEPLRTLANFGRPAPL
jgi:2-methylcitrate dehydratase